MIQQIDLVVFDLDGTLADSLPDLTQAANYACRSLGVPEHPAGGVKGVIGGGELVRGIFSFVAAGGGGGREMPLNPAPEPLLALIKEMGAEPGRTLMVGDKLAAGLGGARGGAPARVA